MSILDTLCEPLFSAEVIPYAKLKELTEDQVLEFLDAVLKDISGESWALTDEGKVLVRHPGRVAISIEVDGERLPILEAFKPEYLVQWVLQDLHTTPSRPAVEVLILSTGYDSEVLAGWVIRRRKNSWWSLDVRGRLQKHRTRAACLHLIPTAPAV